MEFEFDNRFHPDYDYLEQEYAFLQKVAFERLGVAVNYEVDCSLVDEEEIHNINREYRQVDRVTDVISFAFNDDENEKEIAMANPEIPHMLGEIFICVPRALEQAKEIGNSDERELSFLFVHGLLHLLGYDHMKEEDAKIMFPLQEEILALAKERKSDD